jgi:hypothetical protein
MNHRSLTLAVIAVCLLPFHACTCQRDAPEPPAKLAERPSGFGAMAVTPRRPPEPIEVQITPTDLEAREAPDLPPATPEVATLPDNFPEDLPIPEGAEVMAVQSLANDARNVVFVTEGESPQLYSMFKDTMERSGWNTFQQYEGNDQSFLSFRKGDTITNVSVSRDPKTGKRIVAVMYYDEEPLPFPEF